MQTPREFLSDLTTTVGDSWNRFWYTPSDPFPTSILRIIVGIAALYFVLSHSADLVRWFGHDGLLPSETVATVEQAIDGAEPSVAHVSMPTLRLSYLDWFRSPASLWFVHAIGLLIIAAFTIGLATRYTAVLSFIVVVSYMNRAPMITGEFEPLLSMLLLYLCVAPAGLYLSLDRFLLAINSKGEQEDEPTSSITATIAVRLMQVHLSLFYLLMALSKLAGRTWWDGEAVWWLITRTEARIVDLTFLHNVSDLVYLWTHLIVLFELLFAILIWNRWARPILLVLSVPMWISLGMITGLVSFSMIMLAANLVFVPADVQRTVWRWLVSKTSGQAPHKATRQSSKEAATA